MLSRALSLATVTLLIGCLAAIPVRAQNLDAGKSPSQIFSGTCAACHKSPRGLLKTVPAGSLPGFLRQHYTTSGDMAKSLGAFLISNGATDTRVTGTKPTQQPRDVKPDAQPQQAARPDADQLPQGDPGRQGRNAKRQPRPGEAPDAAKPAVEGEQPAVQAAIDRGPDSRKSAAKQKLGKKGKGGEEPPKTDTGKADTARDEPARGEPANDEASKSDTAKTESGTPDSSKPSDAKPSDLKPSDEGKSETANVHPPKDTDSREPPALRADPVPAVTPAPKSPDGDTPPVQTATPAPPAASGPSATASTGATEPAAAASPAVTASVPPPPAVAPAGPPAPPISQ
jgi:hypothetical protein